MRRPTSTTSRPISSSRFEVQVNGSSAVVVSDARSDKNKGAEVKIKKFTNGEDADRAPGPSIRAGQSGAVAVRRDEQRHAQPD